MNVPVVVMLHKLQLLQLLLDFLRKISFERIGFFILGRSMEILGPGQIRDLLENGRSLSGHIWCRIFKICARLSREPLNHTMGKLLSLK